MCNFPKTSNGAKLVKQLEGQVYVIVLVAFVSSSSSFDVVGNLILVP